MATKISNFLVKSIVFFAVLGVVFLLTMYNAKLLNTLNWFKTSNPFIDNLVIIISSIAYSFGSIAIVIWYNPVKSETESNTTFIFKIIGTNLLKLIFVIIDGIHVYVYNNTHIKDLEKWLSPVYAFQTSIILFFVGAIVNDIIKKGKENDEQNSEFNILKTKLKVSESKSEELNTYISNLQTDIENLHTKIKEKESIINDTKSNFKVLETKIDKYYPYYIKLEASRIKKKNESNRTPQENRLLSLAKDIQIKNTINES